jgi:catechol 2,3-dioxygenase-like lactoylglutathione lyase family enzyme
MARLVGINHIALEVGDIDEALRWYGQFFEFDLRGRGARMAFVDMGDQFIALAAGRTQPEDRSRHFGLVVDVAYLERDVVDPDQACHAAYGSGAPAFIFVHSALWTRLAAW